MTVYVASATLLLATLGLANPVRFQWALRAVAATVLVAGAGYFCTELVEWRHGKRLGVLGRRSDTSLWNAGMFLLVFGLPAFRFLLSGFSGSAIDSIAVGDEAEDSTTDEMTDPYEKHQ